ncbi:2'-5' RNA ligase family protein [Actinopolyspora mortivallis]|uniref:2'-5' RNA ligase family protein n=1 Tax=Actinopolyspora mortivallis TaxID=33906 RepID=A0A2T0H095_ACTMO|nr:2'-5' RNA ligase family protein [Actinopolyspora mortivallis]PRW64703.1 2'-5' RNA ligase family protein [Actinopolyspora mortivallis]
MAHADQVRKHVPRGNGTRPEESTLAWLLPLGNSPELRGLANQYQYSLRDLPGFDPVPLEWMHILLQESGGYEQAPQGRVEALLEAARQRLSSFAPLSLSFHGGVVLSESLALPAEPQATLTDLRGRLREATAEVLGTQPPEEPEEIDRHVSLAYATADGPAVFAKATLEATQVEPVTLTVPGIALVRLYRDHSGTEWSVLGEVELAG